MKARRYAANVMLKGYRGKEARYKYRDVEAFDVLKSGSTMYV